MTVGSQAGTIFRLDEKTDTKIGRGLECSVVLTDPLCSRVHAVVQREDDRWTLSDHGSRNGSYVNDQKIDTATLVDGCRIRVGSTEFAFHETPFLARQSGRRLSGPACFGGG